MITVVKGLRVGEDGALSTWPQYWEKQLADKGIQRKIYMLGGPGMNTRLNMALREKKGYVYSVESAYAALSDAGLFTIYAGMDHKNLEKCQEMIHDELRKLRRTPLGPLQLQRAKRQLIGQTCLTNESNLTEMLSIGKNHLLYDEVETIPELLAKMELITAGELMEMADEMLDGEQLSSLLYI